MREQTTEVFEEAPSAGTSDLEAPPTALRRVLTGAAAALLLSLPLVGCAEPDGPAEKAGEAIDEAVEDVGEAVEEAKDDVEEAVDGGGEGAEEMGEEMGESLEEAAEDVGEEIDEAVEGDGGS